MNVTRLTSPVALEELRARLIKQRQEDKTIISVCAGTGCLACGCEKVSNALHEALVDGHLEKDVELKRTGCHGFCERGPLVVVHPQGIFYQRVRPSDAKLIVNQTIKAGQMVNRLLYSDPMTKKTIVHEAEIPFYKKQMRLIFGKNGHMDPTSINDYIALGGYGPLVKALKMQPEEIIQDIVTSGLRGRGGGGDPTGKKWATCRKTKGTPKYVICNADEGDPGAFMDRSLLEGNPHSVIEGMIIGAYAIGSNDGFVYVRNEYPLAVKNLMFAIDAAGRARGKNIWAAGFGIEFPRRWLCAVNRPR
jgi:NADH-quinone oxidoreductase subunit F